MSDLRWKTASQVAPHSPTLDHPGVSPKPMAAGDATNVIWQNPMRYDPFFHGPPYLPGMRAKYGSASLNDAQREEVQTALRKFAHGKAAAINEVSGMQVSEMTLILVFLKALSLIHQSHHWATKGPQYYADHLLFDRLYSDVVPEVDSVAERSIGISGETEQVNPTTLAIQVAKAVQYLSGGVEQSGGPDSFVGVSLRAELTFLLCVQVLTKKMQANNALSRGTDNLLAGIEDKHEEHIYLLQQRTGGGKASLTP